MKHLLILAAVAAFGGSAQASEPTIETACIRAAAAMAVAPSVTAEVVQSFPELRPPRVKIRYKISGKDGQGDAVLTCKFRQSKPPFDLTELCITSGCVSAVVSTTSGRALFEEISTLLKREGM